MRNAFLQRSPKNKCVLVELDMKRWRVQGERQPSWGMMGGWTEEVRLPPSDWIFLFLFRLLPGCSPQVRLPDLGDHLAGFLQCLQREGASDYLRAPGGASTCSIVCFVWFCMEQLRLMLSYDRCLWVLDQLKYFWFIFVCETTVWQTMFLSVEILHGTTPSSPKV